PSGLPAAFAEQPIRTEQQYQQHQQEAVDVLIRRRDERGAKAFHDAKEQAADQRAGDRAQSSDNDDLEALHRRYHTVGGIYEEQRCKQSTRKTGEGYADRKRNGIKPEHID